MKKQKKNSHRKQKKSLKRTVKLILQVSLVIILLMVVAGIIYFYHNYGKTLLQMQAEAKKTVRASTQDTFKASQTSLVYDTEGELISTLKSEKDTYYIDYEDIPAPVIRSMIVTEDKKFMEHDGVDYIANIRAAIALLKHKGEITQGASTVTQQLARNIFLTNEVTYERKIKEIFYAQELEKKYTKTEIMEFYINNIYFANGHYGILAAANGYFSKGVAQLSLSQLTFLCAIPNNPTIYNPVTNMNNTMKRRDRILKQLYQDGDINLVDYRQALEEKITLNPPKNDKKNYVETYVYYSATRALMKKEGFEFRNQFADQEDKQTYDEAYSDLYNRIQKDLFVSGYRIYTSIDLKKQEKLQKSVDQALQSYKEKNEEGVYKLQGAAVCIDNDSGRVVAIVGGRSQELKGYTLNRGYQSFRQPGSSIKPLIVYTPSLERGYYPNSIVKDEPIKDGPKNADGYYAGEIKLQRAIELSKNTIAWKLFEKLTPGIGLSYLMNMKFSKLDARDYTPAAALGGFTIGTSPLEMAAAFATLENDGNFREPTCIVKIMDSEGNEVVGDTIPETRIYEEKASKMMTEILIGAIKNGTGKGLGLTNTISAGKTGTTNDKKDGWFVGYTPYYTTSVWVGFDMPKRLTNLAGATYPGTIWHNFMEAIHTPSMTDTFELYDWRTVLKQEKEASRQKEEAEKEEEEDHEYAGPDRSLEVIENPETIEDVPEDTEGDDNEQQESPVSEPVGQDVTSEDEEEDREDIVDEETDSSDTENPSQNDEEVTDEVGGNMEEEETEDNTDIIPPEENITQEEQTDE